MNKYSADSVLSRLQLAAGVKSDSALSRALCINRATLGNWRKRDSVPYSVCVKFSEENGVSLNWLLAGQGSMKFKGMGQAETLSSDRTMLIELFDTLSRDQQQQVLQLINEKKRLNDLEKAVEDLQHKIILASL